MNDENQKGSIQEKKLLAEKLSVIIPTPTYTILHEKMGIRSAQPWVLVLNAAALTAFPTCFPALAKPCPFLMPLFGIATLAAGLAQRHFRWRELLAGQTWHSYSNGIPYIELFKGWPGFLKKENRLVRWIEPLMVWVCGLIVTALLSRALGVYLMITSAFMWLFQYLVRHAAINSLLDLLDGIIHSEAQARNLAYYKTTNPTTPPPSVRELEGSVATGLSPELLKTLELKRAAKKFNAPDNLASTRA
jgi:hypothetical protein